MKPTRPMAALHGRASAVVYASMVAALLALLAAGVHAAESGEKVWRYQPNQIARTVPAFDYAPDGRTIMVKRYAFFPAQDLCQFRKYRFYENKHGVEHVERGAKLKREPDEILSEQQRAILREWGQPDYLRGPYKSTRGDSVIEWAYLPLNRLFQFVDRKMVYEGPLTDQERIAIVHGAPRDVLVSQVGPNVRRETWLYYPYFLTNRQKVFSFSNGKLVYSKEHP